MIARLCIKELWPAPLTQTTIDEFRIRLSDRALEARVITGAADRREAAHALKHRIGPIWINAELETFVGIAMALEQIRTLNANYRRRLAWTLLGQGRFEASAGIYSSLLDDDHRVWREYARGLAGAGRLDAAADAIARSGALLAIAPADTETEIHATMKSLNRRVGVLEPASGWIDARQTILEHLGAGRGEDAAQALATWFDGLTRLIGEAIDICRNVDADPPSWTRARERALAWLLLGRQDRAGDCLIEASRGELRPSPQDAVDTLELIRIVAVAQPAQAQSRLLGLAARLSGDGEAREALGVAAAAIGAGAHWRSLAESGGSAGEPTMALIATACARSGPVEAAITLFGALTRASPADWRPRRELAACQSVETIRRIAPRPRARPGPRRIFDLFPYNGEVEVLKIKLHEMAPWVDRFVLVESAFTFTGRPKPTFFKANQEALKAFLPKIVHVVVEQFPEHATTAWTREFHQRDEAVKALDGLWAPDDLVLLTDADEVIDRRAIEDFAGDAAPLRMHFFRHFLNYRLLASDGKQRGGASVWRAALLEHYGSSFARTVLANALGTSQIKDAGWHFNSIGDAREVARKLSSYSHQEHDRVDNEARYGALLARLRGGKREPGWEVCDPELLPAYARENWDELQPFLL